MIEWIATNWTDLLLIVTSTVTLASIIVKLTPTPKDDAILAVIVGFLDKLALNDHKDGK